MKRRFLLMLALTGLVARTEPSMPAGEPKEAPGNPPSAAEEFVGALVADDFAGAVGRFDPALGSALSAARLREVWNSIGGQAGRFKQTLGTRTMSRAGLNTVFVTCEFERAIVDAKVVFDSKGRICGLWFVPGERPAPDSSPPGGPPETVREQALSVGDGPWALPGTLSLPAAPGGPRPAVVLVHGSGPNDRDETVGLCKPFRDLAWGLAARGIAVLRYDKATQVHPGKFRSLRDFTVKEETLDDALRAVDRLRRTEGIATNRIFVLGHSLGGTVAPRIAQADPTLAGVIILAGATRPLEDLMVEQTAYLLALDGSLSTDDQTRLDDLRAQAGKVKQLTADTSGASILGAPASYWLDLRRYDAVAAARELRQPLLILQGGRDYQVTERDFDGWKKGLAGRPDTTFQWLPELNHLFVAGTGKSSPAEYERPGRVAEAVLDVIARWIAR